MTAEDPDPLTWLEEEQRVPGPARVQFQRQLADCDARLVAVGRQVGDAIVPVTEAFLEADAYAAAQLIDRLAVEHACAELEDECYALLARQSPVAGDLRRLVAILRSTADVQRSGSLLRHVLESLKWVHPPSMPADLRHTIGELGDTSGDIFTASLDAWADHDGLAANELDARDEQVDLLQKWLLTTLYNGDQSVEEAVSLALIARYYERVADHGVELARHVAYYVTGERLLP